MELIFATKEQKTSGSPEELGGVGTTREAPVLSLTYLLKDKCVLGDAGHVPWAFDVILECEVVDEGDWKDDSDPKESKSQKKGTYAARQMKLAPGQIVNHC